MQALEALGCDDEYMVEKTMGMNGLAAVGKVPGKTTLTVPELNNPSNDRWITVELTITEKPGAPVEKPVTPEKKPVTPEKPVEKPTIPEKKPVEDADFRAAREEVVRLTNAERAKAGLAPLKIDETLMEAAQIRANETLQSFSHTRPDGRVCFSILNDMRISYGAAAENIGMMRRGSAEGHVNGWMNSDGHRANIMEPSSAKIGVGYILDSYGNSCSVQLFTD